jgi:pimeloyl-ACP methyl ester carboxylesterase
MTSADAGTRTVWAGDAAFSYLDSGSGPSMVLLHGIGSAAVSFRYQVETLSARFRVVAVGRPGLWRFDAACNRATMRRCSMRGSARSGSIAATFADILWGR